MPKSIGHRRACDCARCVGRRAIQKRAIIKWRKKKQTREKDEKHEEERKVKALLLAHGIKDLGRLEEYYLRNKRELTEINGSVSPIDIREQFKGQGGLCHLTGRRIKLNGDWNYIDAPVVMRNDPITPWQPDNIRIVTVYAERYVIDPGWGGTLDSFKEQPVKGRDDRQT